VDRARAGGEAALADWAGSVLRACAEIETLLSAEALLAAEERVRTVAVEQARSASDLAQSRYERGLDNVITLLSAQRASAQAESALLDVRRRRLVSRVDLHLALGGDFDTAPRDDAAGKESES
jgi:outer membrane protein TolC